MKILRIGTTATDRWNKNLVFAEHLLEDVTEEDYGDYLKSYEYGMIVVDVGDRRNHNLGLMKKIRSIAVNSPCVVISKESDGNVKASILDAGSDDVIDVDCSSQEFRARLRAITRRWGGHTTSILQHGPISLDLANYTCTVKGLDFTLTRREFSLLEVLMLNRDKVVSKQRLLDLIYDTADSANEKAIDVFIHRLRVKFSKRGLGRVIRTIWGHGYQLIPAGTLEKSSSLP